MRKLSLMLGIWLLIAVGLGAAGWIQFLRPPWPQGVILALAGVLIFCFRRAPGFRIAVLSIPLSSLVAFHGVRLVGFYLIYLSAHGRLPRAFALPAGTGDVAIASGAVLLVLFWRKLSPAMLGVWNVFGLIDIVMVIASAARLAWLRPGSMTALLQLPLSLLPTFVLPLILFTHYVIFVRLLARRPAPVA